MSPWRPGQSQYAMSAKDPATGNGWRPAALTVLPLNGRNTGNVPGAKGMARTGKNEENKQPQENGVKSQGDHC